MRSAGALVVLLALAGCGRDGGSGTERELALTTRGSAEKGAEAIQRYGCGACHVIPGVRTARGLVGPPLTDYARRAYIAGNLYNTADNLVAWIRRPDSVEPGTVMPVLGVSVPEARDIAAYLYMETATGGLGPPRLLPAELLERP